MKRAPRVLNKVVDVVLAYHPKIKSKKAKKRHRKRKTLVKPGTAGAMVANWNQRVPKRVHAALDEAIEAFEN